jgi:hypothetical protein
MRSIASALASLTLLASVLSLASPALGQATSPSPAAAVAPTAGKWRTWVLTSGDALRLPGPPDAAATAAELQELKAAASSRLQGGRA